MDTETTNSSPQIVNQSATSQTQPLQDNNASTNETTDGNKEENPYEKRKRKKTSLAWDEFKEVKEPDGSTRMECVHCKHRLNITKSGATTHFHRHLKTCTRRMMVQAGQRQISATLQSAKSESVISIQNFKYDHAKVRQMFSHMCLVHELPFSFAEYELFNLFMQTNTPNWQKISRATLKQDCVSSYEIEKKKIKTLLKDINRVSITTDLWKSDQKIQYMVVTCHFVDSNFNLQKRTLSFVDIPPPHSGIVICDQLQKCLTEWGLENKLWTVTVDNASCNNVAIGNLRDNLFLLSGLPLDGKFFHVRCCAHILNILVQYGLSEISEAVHNVRESVKYISNSVQRLHQFSEIVRTLKLPNRKLILDVSTRWNATYSMLDNAIVFKDVFPRYSLRDPSYIYLPSADDWKKIGVVCSFLEEFFEVTKVISGTEYPTCNLFLPELWNIKKLLDDASYHEYEFMRNMANKMKVKFDKYWGDINLLISIAAILDPRNKMKFIEFCFPEIYSSSDAIKHMIDVREALYKLYEEYVEAHKAYVSQRQEEETRMEETSTVISKGRQRGRAQFDNFIRNVDTIPSAKSELDIYLGESVHFYNESVDPPFDALDWWKQNSLKFRILSKMACDILSIPITTVSSESSFSAGGRVIDQNRTSLGTNTVEMLMCGEDWLRAHYGIKTKKKDKEDTKEILLLPA